MSSLSLSSPKSSTTATTMDESSIEEIAPHILFEIRNSPSLMSMSNSNNNTSTDSANTPTNNTDKHAELDFVPISPIQGFGNGRSSITSSTGMRPSSRNSVRRSSGAGHHSPSNSFLHLGESSGSGSGLGLGLGLSLGNSNGIGNKSSDDNSLDVGTGGGIGNSIFNNNMFYQSSTSSFASLPNPLPGSPRVEILANESVLSSSTDSLTNSYSLINLSSSPSQSAPSSPPSSKSLKFHSFKQQQHQQQQQQQFQVGSPGKGYGSPIPSNNSNSNNNNNNNNTLSPPSSPPMSCGSTTPVHCSLNDCLLCQRGQPEILIKQPTWASIMRVVFYTLNHEMPEKQFFSLKTDVYEFMTSHWDVLCLNKKRSDNWHKQIQDMLSHSKNIFDSGMDTYKQNGFWRLKQTNDPWTMQKGGRKGSTSMPSSPLSMVSTPASALLAQAISSSSAMAMSASSTSNFASLASPPRTSTPSINIPRLNTSPLLLSRVANNSGIFDDFKKRSSIEMLLENLEMDSPRKKRLSDSGDIQRNYIDSPREELYISESSNN
ncbi:hypothetical protein SAMD00019534_045280 [Acytostelium subglobosum LB1]|uniref:hypothetical protein n=1 Tax=Acytostelium subglobosum LB1 TaxID=1410327 RepID=UPI00064508B0|nr:hypothetical protein SAMD00019534_045280 [Acytostelium subglobosum LB1]GAM21353.1 hypothetical protein SAMD00019534_045280 [Acytostelium subglobosum LB1]|eukprot:XP_012755472.1 hypothetical protein SAMD00019534_045280 [Acytostelium subglobosum LB1]